MVGTRSGKEVIHFEASYGRAARTETKRKRKKRKLEEDSLRLQSSPNDVGQTPRRATRSQLLQEEELTTPPSASNRLARTPTTPPVKNDGMTTRRRQRLPRCTDFGVARHFAFHGRGFLFCHQCDAWDGLLPDCNGNVSSVSRRFACTAKHKTFSHPTTLRTVHCRTRSSMLKAVAEETDSSLLDSSSRSSDDDSTIVNPNSGSKRNDDNNSDSSSDVDEDIMHATTSTFTESGGHVLHSNQPVSWNEVNNTVQEDEATQKQEKQSALIVDQLKAKVLLLREKINDLRRKNKELESALHLSTGENSGGIDCHQHSNRNDNFKSRVIAAIDKISQQQTRWTVKRTGTLVAEALWAQDCYIPELLKLSRQHFRNNVFTPYNILREMDLAGGTLSYEGMDVLRRVETKGHKRFRGSMIPSKSEIKRMAGMIEWFAKSMCPFTLKQTSKGECVEFNYAKTMMCILRAFQLDDIGKRRSLSIASSIDGASLSKNLSIIAGGIKVIDQAARCPITSKPLLDNPTTMKAQSRNLCIPLIMMMGRETKETFTEFGPLFQFFDSLTETDTLPVEMAGFEPFRCMTNCDLSAQWKGLCKGGAAKVHTLPCTGCATDSDSLATPNASLCTRWCSERFDNEDWMCFHKPMSTPEHVHSMRTEVAELVTTLHCDLAEIQKASTMSCHDVEIDDPLVSSTRNATSIHFVPTSTLERQSFSRLLSNELILRGLSIAGSVECRQEKLKDALRGEATIARLAKEIAHGEVKEGAYFLLMHTLPCVLHMENRNGIKLLTMMFIEGLSNAKKGSLYGDVNAEGTRVSRFVSDIECLINSSILGSEDDPCQWMCPFDSKKKEIGPITMDNVRTRRIVDAMDTLVNFCVVDGERALWWTTALNNYRTAMILLRKRQDFTNTEIAVYQNHADSFFQAWVKLWQKEGITNYIHMIGSGHIADYLYKWKNLYRFSQQGWEAMNSLIKTFFFRRTSHGGGVRGNSKKSRLVPIARWLQRRIVFLCRIDEGTIREYAQQHVMPKVFRTQEEGAVLDDVYD